MKNSSYKHLIISSSVIVGLIIIYEIISLINKDNIFIPDFIDILKNIGSIFKNGNEVLILLKTVLKIIIVIFISFLLSLIIHYFNYIFKYNKDIVSPLIFIIKAMPFAIISVYLYILLFNNKNIIPYIVSFLVIFPLVYDGSGGALDINKDIIDEVRTLQGSSLMKYRKVYLPLAFPPMLITFLQAFSLGIKVMVMSEYIASVNNSIGQIINDAKLNLDFTTILSWLILLIIIVVIFDLIVGILKKKQNT